MVLFDPVYRASGLGLLALPSAASAIYREEGDPTWDGGGGASSARGPRRAIHYYRAGTPGCPRGQRRAPNGMLLLTQHPGLSVSVHYQV